VKIELEEVVRKVRKFKDGTFSRSALKKVLFEEYGLPYWPYYRGPYVDGYGRVSADELIDAWIEEGRLEVVKESVWFASTRGSRRFFHRCRYQRLKLRERTDAEEKATIMESGGGNAATLCSRGVPRSPRT